MSTRKNEKATPEGTRAEFVALFFGGNIPGKFLPALCNVHRTFYVPAETVVRAPGTAMPDVGRVYATHTFLKDGEVVGYAEVCAAPGFRGTGHETELFLVEHFLDIGEDGHTRYAIQGHALMTQEQYLRYVKESGFSF